MTLARRLGIIALVATLINQAVALYASGRGGPDLFDHADKVGHVVLFALPALVAVVADLWPRRVVGFLLVHAVMSEAVQARFIPGRDGDPLDVIADVAGIGVGVAAGLLVVGYRRRRRASRGDGSAER